MAFNQDGVNIVITGNASQAMQEIRKVEASINGLLSLEVGSKLQAGFGAMFQTIASSLTKVANAVAGVMKSALAIGGGFEAQMTNVKIISGATADELDKLTAKAREMGAALPITAKDAAQAMELLAQRGTKAKDILVTVADVSALAISQNVDMASAADLLGSTMTNFGIALEDASKVTDIFNNACNQSALSMDKIINAMKYVGPSAKAAGMQLTEAISALEALTNAGLTGEMAGNGLAVALNKLSAITHAYGVETQKLDGSMRSIKDIFLDLQKKNLSLADFTTLLGMRANKVGLILANYAHTLEDNEKNLQKWGATQNAVTEKMKTWTNIWNSFQSATEELHIEIFEQIKSQAKDSVNVIAELTRAFSKWIGETQIAGDTLNAFLDGLGFKLPSVENLQSLLRNFNVQGFLDNVKSFGTALKGIADSIVWAFGMIKTPLAFLIEHLGAFATISFWGWITGKALQIPATIIGIATSMTQLYSASKKLLSLSWGALMNPVGAALTVTGIFTAVFGSKVLEARKAEQEFNDTIERIQQEIKDADADLKLHIDAGEFITGFEKLPDSFFKANDELRKNTLDTIKALQAEFRDKYAKAVEYVSDKFPDLANEAVKAGIDINNASKDTIQQITNALHGGEEEFKKLSPFLQAIVEQINLLDIYAGKGSDTLLDVIKKIKEAKEEAESLKPENKLNTFFEDISANLRNALENIPVMIDEANKYLNGSNGQLAINVSLKQAQEALNKFVKDAADKYAIPQDIVKESLINRLKELASQGNKTAKALHDIFVDVDKPFNDFLESAKEAIAYLGESPNKFMPTLNSMMKNIQKIDPVTGRLTEKFKKAHDALKEWANVTFDKLENRIQKLRKAVEGGFLDKSALEDELKRVMPQFKLQIVSEFEPMKGQFHSERDYQATVASEFISKINELFGDVGLDIMRNLFDGKTGVEMGRAIVNEVQRGLNGNNAATISINGIEQSLNNSLSAVAKNFGMTEQSLHEFANAFGERTNAVAEALSSNLAPVNSSIQLINNTVSNNTNALNKAGDSILGLISSIQTPSSGSPASIKDYSVDFAAVINAIDNINSSAQANISAVNSVEKAVRDINLQPANVNEGNISQAITSAVNPLISGLSQFQSSNDNVSRSIQELSGVIETLRKSTDDNSSALNSLQNSMISSSSDNQNFTGAISPLIGAVQNLDSALNVVVNIQQANSNALNDVLDAVISLEAAFKSLNTGNNYDIDIIQQGFNVSKKSDADYLAREAALAVRLGMGNGGM